MLRVIIVGTSRMLKARRGFVKFKLQSKIR
jgi:hypothetical protein